MEGTTGEEIDFYREQQNKQLNADPNSLYADTMREEKVVNILSQINPDNLLSDIEHRLRGEKKNIFSGDWEPIIKGKSRVSEELIANFMSFLGSILNQNTSMSNFSNQEINNLMEVIIEWVTDDLVVNAGKYGIEGRYTEYDRVGHIVCATCFTVFKRALNGQESRRIFSVLKLTETMGSQKKKGGFIDNFRFW